MKNRSLAIAVIVGALLAGGGVGYAVTHNANSIDAVKQARRDSIFLNCEQGNARHDNTISALKVAVHTNIQQHPEQKARVRESIGPTLLLINALAPKFNCQHRLEIFDAK